MPRRAARRYLSRLGLVAAGLLCALLLALFLGRDAWIRQLIQARMLDHGWAISMTNLSSSRNFTQVAIEHLAIRRASASASLAEAIIPDLWFDLDLASIWRGPIRIRHARLHIDSLDLHPALIPTPSPSHPPPHESTRAPATAHVGLLDFKLRSVVLPGFADSGRSQELLLNLHEPALRNVRIPEDLVDIVLTACLQHGIVLPASPRPPVKSAP